MPDSQILSELSRLFTNYEFHTALIVLLTVVLTNVLKHLLVARAIAFALSRGYDKAIVTKNIVYIPYAVSFLLNLLYTLIMVKFSFAAIKLSEVMASAVLCATLAIGLYEIIKLQLEAYAAKKNRAPENKQVQLPEKVPASEVVKDESHLL
jgi:hypothetical protein